MLATRDHNEGFIIPTFCRLSAIFKWMNTVWNLGILQHTFVCLSIPRSWEACFYAYTCFYNIIIAGTVAEDLPEALTMAHTDTTTDTTMDIATCELNWPRGQFTELKFSENYKTYVIKLLNN